MLCKEHILIMALVTYDTNIIHFHMDPARLVSLDQSYFMHNDYLELVAGSRPPCCIQS